MVKCSARMLARAHKYWCYLKKMYVDPEQSNCDEFKHPIRGPLDKYV